MAKKKWTQYRWGQLYDLEQLLSDCQSIDSANNITARLKRLMKVSSALSRTDHKRRQSSFIQFLSELAAESDRGQA